MTFQHLKGERGRRTPMSIREGFVRLERKEKVLCWKPREERSDFRLSCLQKKRRNKNLKIYIQCIKRFTIKHQELNVKRVFLILGLILLEF